MRAARTSSLPRRSEGISVLAPLDDSIRHPPSGVFGARTDNPGPHPTTKVRRPGYQTVTPVGVTWRAVTRRRSPERKTNAPARPGRRKTAPPRRAAHAELAARKRPPAAARNVVGDDPVFSRVGDGSAGGSPPLRSADVLRQDTTPIPHRAVAKAARPPAITHPMPAEANEEVRHRLGYLAP
jgi:hypothetical protein